jgi:hypothetical protein
VRQMSPSFLTDIAWFGSDPDFRELLPEGAFCTETGKESAKVYWRFISDFGPIRSSRGQVEQNGQFMHIAQSRINIGNCACS